MAKNILIFSDGTGQSGGLRPDQQLSNIYKLFRATRIGPDNSIDPAQQVAFYDPGLGTERDEGRIHIRLLQGVRKFISAALGVGISRNITDCYEAIIKYYEPGDRVFLFGFSRGAYTARCVGGVMQLCGIPTRSSDGSILPRWGSAVRAIATDAVRNVYEHGAGRDPAKFKAEREELGRRFRSKYGSDVDGNANVLPYFVGVFDTVAALGAKGFKRFIMNAGIFVVTLATAALLGWASTFVGFGLVPATLVVLGALLALIALAAIRSSLRVIASYPSPGHFRWHFAGWRSGFYDQNLDRRVRFARHALAIDETRADFARVPWASRGEQPLRDADEPEWLRQIWFAGCHSDVGGSYAEVESRLSDISLSWMVEQTTQLPHRMQIDGTKLRLFPSAAGMQHCEVQALRDRYPSWVPVRWRFAWPQKHRVEAMGAPLHPTVFDRFDAGPVVQSNEYRNYRPATLRNDIRLRKYYDEN